MLTATYQSDKDIVEIRGEVSDFMALHGTVRKVMLTAASYEQDHHQISNFLICFMKKIEKTDITIGYQELLLLGTLLNLFSQYTDMDQEDQICLLLIDSFITAFQTSAAEDQNDYKGYLEKLQSFRDVKAFVASFPVVTDDFFNKHHYDER